MSVVKRYNNLKELRKHWPYARTELAVLTPKEFCEFVKRITSHQIMFSDNRNMNFAFDIFYYKSMTPLVLATKLYPEYYLDLLNSRRTHYECIKALTAGIAHIDKHCATVVDSLTKYKNKVVNEKYYQTIAIKPKTSS